MAHVLIVAVAERPSLESVDIKGNKDIKTEDLQKSLRNVGLSAGKTFDRSTLDEVTQYLTDQYYSRGKYAVKIDTKVENLPDNRVRVNIDIKEGSRAKIRADQHRRQHGRSRTRTILDDPVADRRRTGSPGTSRATATHARRCRATWRRSRPTTRIAATPTSTSTRCRSRSRRTRATSSSPRTSPKARSTSSARSSWPAI